MLLSQSHGQASKSRSVRAAYTRVQQFSPEQLLVPLCAADTIDVPQHMPIAMYSIA